MTMNKFFTVDAKTRVITFTGNVELTIGSLCDGDVLYFQQGGICVDAEICYFDVDPVKAAEHAEEHCMHRICVYKQKEDADTEDFFNFYATPPTSDEYELLKEICVYCDFNDPDYMSYYHAQMAQLVIEHSTLDSI